MLALNFVLAVIMHQDVSFATAAPFVHNRPITVKKHCGMRVIEKDLHCHGDTAQSTVYMVGAHKT